MKWTEEAEEAIRKVPFFVRKRVRTRVEKEAGENGKSIVSLAEVKATQQRYLSGMESEIKGYRLENCFGSSGCPNRAYESESLYRDLEILLKNENLLDFLRSQVQESLKFHHEFTLTIADCPNACSQPQIRDVGIIAAAVPGLTEKECTQCGSCEDICKEDSIRLEGEAPVIDSDICIYCGQCVKICPSGTLATVRQGYRVLLGGKLGRHPRLARELPGIFSREEVLEIVKECIAFLRKKSRKGERFAALFQASDFDAFADKFKKN